MDNQHKIVGYFGREPVYALSEAPGVVAPRVSQHPPGEPPCLACLFNALIDPLEDMEQFAAEMELRMKALGDAQGKGDAMQAIESEAERRNCLRDLALVSHGIMNLKALLSTALYVIEQ